MGNRVATGSTGVFKVEVFEDSVISSSIGANPMAVGTALYKGKGGEYEGRYNVTVAGHYALHVRGKVFSGKRVDTKPSASSEILYTRCLMHVDRQS